MNGAGVAHYILGVGCGQSAGTLPDDGGTPGIGWDYAYGLGGAGDVGIWTAWTLTIPAGESRTLVQTTHWLPETSCNTAPTASAAAALDLPTCDDPDGLGVILDGLSSADPDGDSLTYAWSFASVPAGSAATIDDPTAGLASFEPDLPGTYVLALVVNDGSLDSDPTTTSVTVDTAELAEAMLCAALAEINALPSAAFDAKGHQTALANFVEQALADLVDKGDPAKALDKAQDALERVDGCHGGSASDDWIPACAESDRVATLLERAISALSLL